MMARKVFIEATTIILFHTSICHSIRSHSSLAVVAYGSFEGVPEVVTKLQ
jgi:hypothetical protein